MFSRRTAWEASANELTEILKSVRAAGRRVIDLTVSNPTECGFPYPGDRILRALASPASLTYSPDPRGLLSAREAVARYYLERGCAVSPSDIFLTASTSESYSLLFKLLCDPGDAVLVPRPSYPLFEYLAGVNDVDTVPYGLSVDRRWEIDTASVRDRLRGNVRAVVVVNPHNPTGSFVSAGAWNAIVDAAAAQGAAVIVDEVFRDYAFSSADGRSATGPGDGQSTTRPGAGPAAHDVAGPAAGEPDHPGGPLTFILNGLSKTAALPQMKLGWIVVRGNDHVADEAKSRLEILNDTFLSANTPVQAALPELLAAGDELRPAILRRLSENYGSLRRIVGGVPGCGVLPCEGGWNALVRLGGGLSDAEAAEGLLREKGVYCYPGYFFDFGEEDILVLSLLAPEGEFGEGVRAIADWVGNRSGGPYAGK